jgi:hypothetical protein
MKRIREKDDPIYIYTYMIIIIIIIFFDKMIIIILFVGKFVHRIALSFLLAFLSSKLS